MPLTVAQVRAIADAAPPDLRALVILAAATGLRSGELLGLTIDRVHFLRRTVAVDQQLVYVSGQPPVFGPPKTKASRRTVPVPTFALEALADHVRLFPPHEPDGLLFTSSKGAPVLRPHSTVAGVERCAAPVCLRRSSSISYATITHPC